MKIKIVYSDNCPHCQEFLTQLKNQGGIHDKELDLVNVTTPEGIKAVIDNSLDAVPSAINEHGMKCEIRYTDGHVDIVCPDTEHR